MKQLTGFITVLILGTLVGAFSGFAGTNDLDNNSRNSISRHFSSNLYNDDLHLDASQNEPENSPLKAAREEFYRGGDSLILFAGNDTTVCLSGFYTEVSGFSQNFYYTSWATTGDGFFAQAINLNTQYIPGPQDIANGLANLYLVGICVQPEYLRIVDSLKITLVPHPDCFAGIDASVCSGEVFQTQAEASWYSDLLWTTSGDGTFDQVNQLTTHYQHGANDLDSGQVFLQLTAFPMEPCQVANTNQMTLYIKQAPLLAAGNDTILCEDEPLQLDADVSFDNEILWTTIGDGTFSDMSVSNPVYTPGPGDISNGGTLLSVIVTPEYPCETIATDNLALGIVSQPEVSIGTDQTICETDVVQCLSFVENYDHLQWMVLGGNGHFADSSAMNTAYYPGEHEKTTGVCYIMIIVHANNPCQSEINAFFKVELVNKAMISAGPDQDICSNDTAMLFGMGERYEDVFWETTGDGTFIGDENLSRKYIPGLMDKQSKSADIYLCASSAAPCDELVCDTITINIQNMAVADAGNDATICTDASLTGQADNYLQVFWATSGDGTFEDSTVAGTIYHAGDFDVENLIVTLTLYAEPAAPCEGMIEDEIEITIDRPVLISSDVTDQEVISGGSTVLSIEASSFQSVEYQWFHGDDTLQGANTSQLALEDCLPEHAGFYHCKYGNECFNFSSDTSLISVLAPSVQTLNFTSGWNAVSSYVVPATSEIEVVLMPILDDLVFLYSNEGFYYPDQDMLTFTYWNSNTGYIVKTTATEDLTINGYIKYPAEPILIEPGWSMLPAGLACPLSAGELFAEYPQIKAVKEIGGMRIYWPELGIFTLDNIKPGKSYEVYNTAAETVSFTFPECDE